jgi:hypothetical protein
MRLLTKGHSFSLPHSCSIFTIQKEGALESNGWSEATKYHPIDP